MLKKEKIFLLLFSICACLNIFAYENLVDSPGFEDAWDANSQGGSASFKRDSNVKQSGTYSALIDRHSSSAGRARWFQLLNTKANIEYLVSASYKTDTNFSGTANVMIHGAGVHFKIHQLSIPSSGAGGWQTVNFVFTPTQSGEIGIYLQNEGTGKIWFDNVTIKQREEGEGLNNLLPNSQFEILKPDGKFADWWTWSRQNVHNSELNPDSSVKFSGSRSAKISVPQEMNDAFITLSPRMDVYPGDRIRFSCYCRGALDKYFYLAAGYRTSLGLNTKVKRLECVPESNWKKFECIDTIPPKIRTVDFRIRIPEKCTGEIWVDNAVLQKINVFSLNLSPYEESIFNGDNVLNFELENYLYKKDDVKIVLKVGDNVLASKNVAINGEQKQAMSCNYSIDLPEDKYQLEVSVLNYAGDTVLFKGTKTISVKNIIEDSVVLPTYVWQGTDTIKKEIKINLPDSELSNLSLRIKILDSANAVVHENTITNVQAEQSFSYNISNLASGKYNVSVKLVDSNNTECGLVDNVFYVMDQVKPKIEIKNKKLFINDQAFFPIGMFQAPLSQEYVDAGFNLVHNYGFEGGWEAEDSSLYSDSKTIALMDKVRELGLWCICGTPRLKLIKKDWEGLRKRFEALKSHPSILCFSEEEQMARGSATPEIIKQLYDMFKEIDPAMPVLVGDTPSEDPPNWLFKPGIMDIGIWWWYPFPLPEGQTEIVIPAWLTANVAADQKPIWVSLQADTEFVYNEKPDKYPADIVKTCPSYEQYRCQAYLAVIHGATGLMYFTPSVFSIPERLVEFKKVIGELKDISPVLLADNSTLELTKTGCEKISVMLKEHNGKYYLLAANRDKSSTDAGFQFPSQISKVTVKYEDREVGITSNGFTDTFNSYEVHVYEIEK